MLVAFSDKNRASRKVSCLFSTSNAPTGAQAPSLRSSHQKRVENNSSDSFQIMLFQLPPALAGGYD